ncbi:MAG: DEAD/DEAH box helicase family protein [bacterium]|nr:DEAD/DEAH box helicase family protein [bacterium]
MPLRKAQLGAMHALASHFFRSSKPAIVVLPTGVGKTAVAQAAPFVLEDVSRVLVVVPSKVLRSDAAEGFRTLAELKKTSLIPVLHQCPVVHELKARPPGWEFADACDVVVATPQSASPSLLSAAGLPVPDPSLFDLVIVDEGHHVSAPTWTGLVDHFPEAYKVLLTATPYRRDRKNIVGTIVFDYPLEAAVSSGAYSPVSLVPVQAAGMNALEKDRLVAQKAVERLRAPEHSTSALLIRTESKTRANEVSKLYENLGVKVAVVHSGLTAKTVRDRLAGLRNGDIEAVSFVGILGEGFDHPTLKIGAYHDKHKSLPATLQFIGRLSRQTTDGANAEVVTVVEDLEADTWQLYQHDAVWEELIPELADTATHEVVAKKALVSQLPPPPGQLSLHEVEPKRKAVVYELNTEEWEEPFSQEGLSELGLVEGARFGSGRIYYAAADPADRLLILITAHDDHPAWMRTRSLDAITYQLHIAVAEPADLSSGQEVSYLFVSSSTRTNENKLARLVGNGCEPRIADPDAVNRCMEAFKFEKYQGVGLRAVGQRGAGRATYRNLLGSGVDSAVQAADTRGQRLGHAMGTASNAPGKPRSTAGISTVNARIFESSFTAISGYVEWTAALARMIRDALTVGGSVPLIPSLGFDTRLRTWPKAQVIGAELPAEVYTSEFHINGTVPLDCVNLKALLANDQIELYVTYEDETLWAGQQDLSGRVLTKGKDSDLTYGHMTGGTLGEFLQQFLPTIFFADGASVTGRQLFKPMMAAEIDPQIIRKLKWHKVDICRERRTGNSATESVQDYCERILLKRGAKFVVLDDGSGELADYIAIDISSDIVDLSFVHCKASSQQQAGLRLKDMMVLLDQSRRSARWIQQGKTFWEELARRLEQRTSTQVLSRGEFGLDQLKECCQKFAVNPPKMQGTVIAAQPGLDTKKLQLASESPHPGSSGQGVVESIMQANSLIQSAAIGFIILGS